MSDYFFCENCGDIDSKLTVFRNLKKPYKNLCLCNYCADLPLKEITRREWREFERSYAETSLS